MFSFFTYAFPVFSELSMSTNLAMLFHCGAAPHLSLWQKNPGCPGHGIYWGGHQPWVASQGRDGQEGTEVRGCVSVSVSNAQLSHSQGQGREGMNLPQDEAQSCSGAWAPVFHTFFPSRTLLSIICRSFGAPWTEELPVG